MAKTSDFLRIATEGATTDGRVIERDWIDQMAAGYNPATYTATINCEHIRGFSPDAPFNSYGRVVALKAEDFELEIDGKKQKRRGLYAQLEANDNLVATVSAGQKLFTSCEVSPNFAATGKAGLVGLAITDNPASLGTEAMKFAAGAGDANPFAARKKDKANLFTAADAATIAFAAEDQGGILSGITAAIAAGFAKLSTKPEPEQRRQPDTPPANDNELTAFAAGIEKVLTETVTKQSESFATTIAALRGEVTALKTKLETTEQPDTFRRQPSTGGAGGGEFATDC